jgi:hypothetical protein
MKPQVAVQRTTAATVLAVKDRLGDQRGGGVNGSR